MNAIASHIARTYEQIDFLVQVQECVELRCELRRLEQLESGLRCQFVRAKRDRMFSGWHREHLELIEMLRKRLAQVSVEITACRKALGAYPDNVHREAKWEALKGIDEQFDLFGGEDVDFDDIG